MCCYGLTGVCVGWFAIVGLLGFYVGPEKLVLLMCVVGLFALFVIGFAKFGLRVLVLLC